MLEAINHYCLELSTQFAQISAQRRLMLERISDYISGRLKEQKPVNLIYICTHNSRRSHFGQIWAKVAASHFGFKNVHTFSGGTEATAFNIHAINALKRAGLLVEQAETGQNPVYQVTFSQDEMPAICFSKVYNHPSNPEKEFAAIMTCGEAEENCPFIPNVDLRIATAYEDPKAFDDSDLRDQKYSERCRQIALECLYVFSKVNG